MLYRLNMIHGSANLFVAGRRVFILRLENEASRSSLHATAVVNGVKKPWLFDFNQF